MTVEPGEDCAELAFEQVLGGDNYGREREHKQANFCCTKNGRVEKKGACCRNRLFPTEPCIDDVTLFECQENEGYYFGDDSSCDNVECEPPHTGACCFNDIGSCTQLMSRGECLDLGGNYFGDGTVCGEIECVGGGIPCRDIKKLTGKCKRSGTIKAIVKLRDKTHDGETLTFQVGERLKFEVAIRGKKAKLFTCCYEGRQTISLIDPEGCRDPIEVDCPG